MVALSWQAHATLLALGNLILHGHWYQHVRHHCNKPPSKVGIDRAPITQLRGIEHVLSNPQSGY